MTSPKSQTNQSFIILELNISDDLSNYLSIPLLSPAAAQYAQFMLEGEAFFSKMFFDRFEQMTVELNQILKKDNITILQLFRKIAIE